MPNVVYDGSGASTAEETRPRLANPGNYRPILNLNTISKVMKRLVMFRLLPHLLSSFNFNTLQSAYLVGQSTETAVLKLLDSFYDKKLTTPISCFRHDQS